MGQTRATEEERELGSTTDTVQFRKCRSTADLGRYSRYAACVLRVDCGLWYV